MIIRKGADDLCDRATHQSALLPLSAAISSLPHPPSPHPPLPTHLVALSPIDLLTALSIRLGIQTYLEDSQFGLLKSSLTLAGSRFVIDIDLETDATEDEDAEDDVERRMEDRGRVRLSKITANHVGAGGVTGRSDWVASVLRERMEGYLRVWNGGAGEVKARRLQRLVEELEGELGDLKGLDDSVGPSGEPEKGERQADYFAELEDAAARPRDLLKVDGWVLLLRVVGVSSPDSFADHLSYTRPRGPPFSLLSVSYLIRLICRAPSSVCDHRD